jgi:ribosome biogenesis GTPase
LSRPDDAAPRAPAQASALVVAGHGRHYLIEANDGTRWHAHTRGKKSDCVVGDRVRWQRSGADQAVIDGIEPRRNLLQRRDAWRSKAFAANLDRLLILLAGEPMFSDAWLGRALLAARHARIATTIVLNKTDLASAAAARAALAPIRAMGEPVVEVSLKAQPEAARQALTHVLAEHVTLLLGQSGMGKSTLVNRFVPDANVQVGAISRALNAGRQTTTTTRWYWLDAGRRSALIDSPGFQEFGLQQIEPTALPQWMPDIAKWTGACRFHNCMHLHEPDCGVRAALARQLIDPRRYELYAQIRAELASQHR